MSHPGRVTFVRSEDLIEAPLPTERGHRGGGIGWRRQLTGLGIALFGLPLLTLLLEHTRASLALDGEVLLYLLVVVVVALVGGVVPALAAAVAASMAINYYFVEPRHTLDVAHTDQAVALVVFLAVAGVVSGAMELAARRARAARQAAREAETLSGLAGTDFEESDALQEVLERARHTFGMESVVLKVRGSDGWSDVGSAGWAPSGAEGPLRFDVPVGSARLVGRGPKLFAEDRRVLRAFAAAAEAAYEGQRLSERAGEARELAEMDRQRTALLAAVGHDLRTPLAGIKASVTTLRQNDVDWSARDRDDLLATIEESADRLDAIVANVLDASRLEAGAFSVQSRPVSLDEVVGAVLLALGETSRHVHVDVPEDLPLLLADPGLLERVLVNLLDNAVRYGGDAQVSAAAGEFSVKVKVSDNGRGVAEDERERLFAPFTRFGDRSGASGLGLGLSVARGFTEAMGGTLIADRAPSGGLLMRLALPLAAPRSEQEETASAPAAGSHSARGEASGPSARGEASDPP